MQGNQSYTKNSLCTQKGGMETLGENEVNPGCIFKKLVPKFPRDNPTNKIKNKKPKICKIKKKSAHVIKLHQRRLKKIHFSSTIGG